MTVGTQTRRKDYAGNGATVSFSFDFVIFATSDLKVYLRDTVTLVDTLMTETTHYSVTGTLPGTGNVVFVTPPSATQAVVILPDKTIAQTLDLLTSGNFAAENVELALDKITADVQMIREFLRRTPRLPVGSQITDLPLPNPVASTLIGWNVTADALTNYSSTLLANGSSLTTAYTLTLLDDPDAATARTTLGIGTGKLASVGFLTGTATIDFASVADNASSAAQNVAVTGAVVGDFVVDVTATGNIATTDGIFLLGKVTANNVVEVTLHNDSAGAFDAASQAIFVVVVPKANVGL